MGLIQIYIQHAASTGGVTHLLGGGDLVGERDFERFDLDGRRLCGERCGDGDLVWSRVRLLDLTTGLDLGSLAGLFRRGDGLDLNQNDQQHKIKTSCVFCVCVCTCVVMLSVLKASLSVVYCLYN